MAGFFHSNTWTSPDGLEATLQRAEVLGFVYDGAGPLHYRLPDWFDPSTYAGVDVSLEELGIELSLYDERAWRKAVATNRSMASALKEWPPTRFRGLGLQFVIPPQPAGPRTIVGSVLWQIRRTRQETHHHHLAVEYPSRSYAEQPALDEWLERLATL